MSPEKKRLENNRGIVDQHIAKKEISFAEPVDMEGALEFLDYLIKEGISDDFAVAQFNKRRQFIQNNEVFPMIYMMNILSGDWSVRRTQTILQNEAALNMMGFTDKQIENKLTQRGKKNQYGEGFDKKPGIMASTTVIDNLACFGYEGLEGCFNSYIGRVAARDDIDLGDTYILDSSIVETAPHYPGAKPVRRKSEDGETEETIWGFKVFVLMSARSKVPVAVHITTANDADSPMLLSMVQKGIDNLGEGRIRVVLADRGFIDGSQMYILRHKLGIDFAIPARKGMDIWNCLTGLRDSDVHIEEWKYGRKGMSGGYLSKGSVSYSQYAAVPAGNSKDQVGAPINGVVVTRWRDKEIAPGKEKVILTSLDTDSAIEVIEMYGQRSLIENCSFRELKQASALDTLPQYRDRNAEKTARLHMLLCVFTLTVFNVMVETAYSQPDRENGKTARNIREFRFMKRCEKSKIFVMVGNYYHIYDMTEFLELAGFTIIPAI